MNRRGIVVFFAHVLYECRAVCRSVLQRAVLSYSHSHHGAPMACEVGAQTHLLWVVARGGEHRYAACAGAKHSRLPKDVAWPPAVIDQILQHQGAFQCCSQFLSHGFIP